MKRCRSVSPKEAASFGKTDVTALGSVPWPAAGFSLPSVSHVAKVTICGAELFRCLGNWEWAGSWREQPLSLPRAVLSCCQSKLLLNIRSISLLLLVIIFLPEMMWYGVEGLVIQTSD